LGDVQHDTTRGCHIDSWVFKKELQARYADFIVIKLDELSEVIKSVNSLVFLQDQAIVYTSRKVFTFNSEPNPHNRKQDATECLYTCSIIISVHNEEGVSYGYSRRACLLL
jgi:hypothetical protein